MEPYILFFQQIDRSSLPYVGGKGANLGELGKAGFPVPGGFCVTTAAYREFIATSREMAAFFADLGAMDPSDLGRLRQLGELIRGHLQQLPMPAGLQAETLRAWMAVGEDYSYAVRSSATAEDLPTASFAGQQDTYLNIRGQAALIEHIRKCWASLFTDRAIAYRAKNGFDHREVYLSVVVQRMVFPETAGIVFTADPVNGDRTVVSIDASFGLGEAIVSGMVSADLYKVKDEKIIHRSIAEKKIAIYSLPAGGTVKQDMPEDQRRQPALDDRQILSLAILGKQIEQHFGCPQDIEFCIENGVTFIVQSRPITSLYPLPDIPPHPLRLMLSLGHIQMMTDAMKPLGISVLKTLSHGSDLLLAAGGRLYIDPSDLLRHRLGRIFFPLALKNVEEDMSRAVTEVIRRPAFREVPAASGLMASARTFAMPFLKELWKNLFTRDPKLAKAKVEAFIADKHAAVRQALRGLQGAARLQAVKYQLGNIKDIIYTVMPYAFAFPIASALLRKILIRRLGDDRELSKLNRSLPGNVTSEMGLEIGDLADLLRTLPAVAAYLETADDSTFYEGLATVPGGESFQLAFQDFIAKYGSRCPGEIDITRPRWREAPTLLTPAILGHMRSVKPGEHRQKFADGEREAHDAMLHILHLVENNRFKSKRARRLIEVFRYMGGLREHHKYLFTLIADECKKAIMAEAQALADRGILGQAEDAYYLTLDELILLTKGEFAEDVRRLVAARREKYQWYKTLKPPRVMTSEGEIVTGAPKTGHFPAGALVGSPVSAGVVEGRARVVLRPEKAFLHAGEVLVAPHTDPGWTPLFQSAVAVVTEVGGLMTHGAVVAREYGIPAVVGIDDATGKIHDGQLIRVDGTRGFVEILE